MQKLNIDRKMDEANIQVTKVNIRRISRYDFESYVIKDKGKFY